MARTKGNEPIWYANRADHIGARARVNYKRLFGGSELAAAGPEIALAHGPAAVMLAPGSQGSGVFGTYGGLSGMHGCGAESHSCEHGHAT
jgi:hypothetical protein